MCNDLITRILTDDVLIQAHDSVARVTYEGKEEEAAYSHRISKAARMSIGELKKARGFIIRIRTETIGARSDCTVF